MKTRSPVAWVVVILGMLAADVARGAPRATVEAGANWSELQPGTPAAIAIRTTIAEGLHAQSRTPTQPNFIKFEVKVDGGDSVIVHEPVYPPGHTLSYPALGGDLNVYEGAVTVYVPVEVKPGAPPGPVTIKGTVRLQACNDSMCFPPERLNFEVATTLASPGDAATPANAKLFEGFDPSIFAKIKSGQPAAKPAATPVAVPATVAFDFFGRQFSIGRNAYGVIFPLAFLIGVIFNLMPCVLPVLPLKAAGFYEVAEHSRAKALLYGTIFSAGVIASFAVLAAMILIFRRFTWGEQFSNPWFVGFIVTVLVLFALGQFGLFSIALPARVYTLAPTGEGFKYLSNFGSGIFTAILSTPCTAPMFVGLLVWAASQEKWVGVTAVMTVGAGMAAPYLVLSAMPEVARKLPRTGPWAELVKQMMGFLLLAVAVYFAGGKLVSGRSFVWAVFVVVAAACVFLVVRTAQVAKARWPIAVAAAIALLLGGGTLAFTMRLAGTSQSQSKELIAWTPYTPDVASAARQTGRVVVVEFTANWCANCLALEATVFHDPSVAAAFEKYNVLALRADLTEEDAPGWALLRQLNPAGGIPLTAIYAANVPDPIQLTSVYSAQNLKDALDRAGRTAVTSTK